MNFCYCDRCGTKVPYYHPRGWAPDFLNCGVCEEDYQISLWQQNYLDKHGWTDQAIKDWEELFKAESNGKTFEQHQKEYNEYRQGVYLNG